MPNEILEKANKVELEPGKKYLLVFDRSSIAMKDLHYLVGDLKNEMNIDSIAVGVIGDPKQKVRVVELPESEQ